MSYRLTPQAQRERESALEYQAEHLGERAAYEMADVFKAVFEKIGAHSPPGSPREQYADRRYQWVQLGKYPYFAIWAMARANQTASSSGSSTPGATLKR